jgi:hypothetical protein
MDFFFPEDNLTRAVPEETKITSIGVETYPDGRRLRVNIDVTPFQKRPYIEVTVYDANGEEIASTSIVEPLSWKLEFTMHVRGEIQNPYTLNARLYYPEGPSTQPQIYSFDVKAPAPSSAARGTPEPSDPTPPTPDSGTAQGKPDAA